MKKFMTFSLIAGLLPVLGTVSAAPRISAQSIIVNPIPSNVSVRVWTDRDSSGTLAPHYVPGERIQLFVRADRDAYVYLFNVDPQGQVDMILPNQFTGGSNFVKANQTKVFPPAGANFTFDIAAPYGLNKVLALASTAPLNLNDIAAFTGQQTGFATVSVQGQGQLAQALSIVVTPVPQNTWNSDTAYYTVVPTHTSYQPAPLRPAPVRPAPVRPAPVRPAPVQPAPVVTTPTPWTNAPYWSSYVDYRYGLQNTHEQYADQLRAQGYRLIVIREYTNALRSEWRRGYGNAVLDVRLVNGQIEVRITQE